MSQRNPSKNLSVPHGGILINRIKRLTKINPERKCVEIDNTECSDFELIANGAYSPLKGFMGKADYESVVGQMRLANGLPWSIPITLAISQTKAEELELGETINLSHAGMILGVMKVVEKYIPDKKFEAKMVYRTADPAHPGVKKLFSREEVYLAGPITLMRYPEKKQFASFYLEPAKTREMFTKLGWKTVVGFQTRNPVHRAHEYIQKTALESVDGLFLNPLVGETQSR